MYPSLTLVLLLGSTDQHLLISNLLFQTKDIFIAKIVLLHYNNFYYRIVLYLRQYHEFYYIHVYSYISKIKVTFTLYSGTVRTKQSRSNGTL